MDEWIIGESTESRQEYLVHLSPPRFVAKMSPNDNAPENGFVYEMAPKTGAPFDASDAFDFPVLTRGVALTEFRFFDEKPREIEDVIGLLEAASFAIHRDCEKEPEAF